MEEEAALKIEKERHLKLDLLREEMRQQHLKNQLNHARLAMERENFQIRENEVSKDLKQFKYEREKIRRDQNSETLSSEEELGQMTEEKNAVEIEENYPGL